MKYVYIETMGCQMNKSDTERMLGMLSHFDYEETKEPEKADLLMVNTCSIRQLSEDKAFSQLGVWGKWKQEGKNIKIGICGCVAQQKANKVFSRAPYVDFVLGTHKIYSLPEVVKKINNGERVCECEETNQPTKNEEGYPINRVKSTNAWINITEGCNNFCTYCIVPYTRGRERSRLPETIIKEAQDALNAGFKEITLLGQNVDSYGKDFKDKNYRLANLLKDLNKLEGKFRIRFVTSYPTDITDELIETAVKLDKVCEYFHIPMQSGSSTVLKAMNRRYTRETYAKIVEKVRKMVPDVTITSDFIAGFPGETEEQFEETLTAIDEFELDYCNVASYSPREKTVAAKWVDKFIPEDVKDERFQRLNKKIQENCLKSNLKYAGREMEVLVESFYEHKGKKINTGKTRNFKTVHIACDKDLTGKFVNVKITGAKTWYLQGEII
ncbi:MAG TPA: tRNA (N6-isopentenyl adenosine(37)-C2)-methylthiotransferase MiaB [Candidatus Stercorousia faecigallinarum]|nr:tRNA (N6-isopentenyl adenosine(37)-C2)-methylthiotransferase MiaB [Candidatus Stercorousia faecigallinarum]